MNGQLFLRTRGFLEGLPKRYEQSVRKSIENRGARRIVEYTSSNLPEGENVPYLDSIARVAQRNKLFVHFSQSEGGNLTMNVHQLELRPNQTTTMRDSLLGNITPLSHSMEEVQYFTIPSKDAVESIELNPKEGEKFLGKIRETLYNTRKRLNEEIVKEEKPGINGQTEDSPSLLQQMGQFAREVVKDLRARQLVSIDSYIPKARREELKEVRKSLAEAIESSDTRLRFAPTEDGKGVEMKVIRLRYEYDDRPKIPQLNMDLNPLGNPFFSQEAEITQNMHIVPHTEKRIPVDFGNLEGFTKNAVDSIKEINTRKCAP